MVKKIFVLVILGFFAVMLLPLAKDLTPFQELSPVAKKYVEDGPEELGGTNLVTSVIVTYRGLDTMGEVAVLFIAAAGVGFFLRKEGKSSESKKRDSSQILQSGTTFLFPLILAFGVYIFLHGHLTPGGGFQGGVVIASGIVLLLLSRVTTKINNTVLHLVESLSGAAYITLGILGLVLAAGLGFLDNRFLDLGEFGRLLSAGAIPLIYSFIGLKVGAELVGIIDNMQKDQQ
ncbi:MAG: Na(+)/H(+) antiporter subunit B [Candidatus Marinimicrobia bacterium]|nr:Na(+)/H(+) antiporter subunit B [Candidatus Neomarinimicrobiota bacterium]